MSDKSERLREINIENYVWIIYIGIIFLSWYANSKEKKFILYDDLNSKKINSILNGKFWVSTYDNLNDPFELKSIFIEQEKIEEQGCPMDLVEMLLEIVRKCLIGCFTTSVANNLPMWAHYANNHKGICIEYKVLSPDFFYPVIYEERRIGCSNIVMNFINLAYKDMIGIILEDEKKKLELYGEIIRKNCIIKHKSWE